MFRILCLVSFAALAACNAVDVKEDVTCVYSLENNSKTCDLTADERRTRLDELRATSNSSIKVIDGLEYVKQEDGSLIPLAR